MDRTGKSHTCQILPPKAPRIALSGVLALIIGTHSGYFAKRRLCLLYRSSLYFRMGSSMKNRLRITLSTPYRKWAAAVGIMVALAGCSSHKPFNRGPYLAYGLGPNAAFVPVEPYKAAENIRRALACNNLRTKPFMWHDLQEDRFLISNAVLPGTTKSYEIIAAWSFTGTLLQVRSSEAVPQVVTTISNYAKQGADCPAAAINKSSN